MAETTKNKKTKQTNRRLQAKTPVCKKQGGETT